MQIQCSAMIIIESGGTHPFAVPVVRFPTVEAAVITPLAAALKQAVTDFRRDTTAKQCIELLKMLQFVVGIAL